MAKKKETQTIEEKLQNALVSDWEQPYKLPENWCWTRLGEIVSVSSGKSLTNKNMNKDGGIPVYGGNGINGYHDKSNISASNIVIGRVGFYCGCVHFIYEDAWVTDNALIVNFNKEKCDIDFLFRLLNNLELGQNNNSTAQPVISGAKIYPTPFPLPPLAEQKRIVDRIESLFVKLDEAKELAQNALNSFENRKSAILHKAFTGELTKKWREENGVSFDSWEETTLKEVCEFITKGETPTKYVAPTGDIPFLKVYNIRDNQLDFEYNPSFIPIDIHTNKMKRSKVYPNDVIMNIVGPPLQKVAIIPNSYDEWNINQAIAFFRAKKSLFYKYLYYNLLWEEPLREVLNDLRGVVGQSNISLEQCRNIRINLPTLPEQQEIVRILDSIFAKETEAKELVSVIDKIDLIKKSILSKAFRGELGTNDVNDESSVGLLREILEGK